MSLCGYGPYSCGWRESVFALGALVFIVILVAITIWIHDHNHHKPWKMKCGWVKIDGMWHFFSHKVTKEEPCMFGGHKCNAAKCAKGVIQSEQKIDFINR